MEGETMVGRRHLSRRRLFAALSGGGALPLLVACGPAATPTPPAPEKPAEAPKPAAAPTTAPAAPAKPTEATKPAAPAAAAPATKSTYQGKFAVFGVSVA